MDVLKIEYLTTVTSFNIAHPPSYLFSSLRLFTQLGCLVLLYTIYTPETTWILQSKSSYMLRPAKLKSGLCP